MKSRLYRVATLLLIGAPALCPLTGQSATHDKHAQRSPASTSTLAVSGGAQALPAAAPALPSDGVSKTGFSSSTDACTPSETWNYGPNVFTEWRGQMRKLLRGGQAVWGFTQALGLRRQAQTAEARTFAEYWISRSLLEAKLPHIAWSGFSVIASREPNPETVGVQLAALDCLSQIHERHPTFDLPAKVNARLTQLSGLAQGDKQKRIVWEYAGNLARYRLASESSPDVASALEVLKGSGPFETFMNGVLAARSGNHSRTIGQLDKFLGAPSRPESLRRFEDQAHLLLSRAYYSTHQYAKATEHLKLIRKSSNELTRALSEMAWAYLQDDKYAEAIGTAINLQQGGLRHAFAPEAPMVMAMALNEICQYPESLRAVNTFRKFYEKPYRWLAHYFEASPETRPELYPVAVRFLKKDKELNLPSKLGSEWVRSPIFISHQDELNLLFETKENTRSLSRSGSSEQKKLAGQIVQLSNDLKSRIHQARESAPNEELAPSIRNSLADLRTLINQYQRFRLGAPVWRAVLANYERSVKPTQVKLVKRINEDLLARSQKMLYQLEEIAENNQLIEVEMYNGASQDIIWQNAHPDYKQVAQAMRDDHDKRAAAKVWDWGRAPASDSDDGGEIWEDELGSFKADLYDNCSSKDKYLKLKRLSYAK